MRTCPQCGFDNSIGAKYCKKCGASILKLPHERRLSAGTYLGKTARYQLEHKLGDGENSTVWLAHDLKTRRSPVALKIMLPEIAAAPGIINTLRRVARKVIPLSHPNLARIYAFERDAAFIFFVTEYVRGPTIAELLALRRKFSEEEVLWVSREVFTALGYIHRRGVWHGKITSGNLMLSQKPPGDRLPTIPTAKSHPHQCVKLCDYTISGVLRDIRIQKRKSRPFKQRVSDDINAVGVLLWELSTGRAYKGRKAHFPPSTSRLMKRVLLHCLEGPGAKSDNPADELIDIIEH